MLTNQPKELDGKSEDCAKFVSCFEFSIFGNEVLLCFMLQIASGFYLMSSHSCCGVLLAT